MRKKILRVNQILCVLFFMIICMCSTHISVRAAEPMEDTWGDWTYTYTSEAGAATLTKYSGSETKLVIPSSVNGRKVVRLGRYLLADSGITEITIPETILEIEYKAFADCVSLEKIYFNAVECEELSYDTFSNAGWETDGIAVVFGNKVEVIPGNLFACYGDIPNIKSVTISNSVREIGASALPGAKAKSLTIPKSVKKIGQNAFNDWKKLEKVYFNAVKCEDNANAFRNAGADADTLELVFGNEVTNVPGWLFSNNKSLTSVTLSDSIKTIGESAFQYCENLTDVKWGNGIEVFGALCFGDTAIKNVQIPETTQKIGGNAFGGCVYVSDFKYNAVNATCGGNCGEYIGLRAEKLVVSFGSKVKNIPSNLFAGYILTGAYSCITEVKISDSVIDIGYEAFRDCHDLEKVTFGNSLEVIGHSSFTGCSSLKSISLPKSVTEIGEWAFLSCDKLEKIVINSKNAAFQSHVVSSKLEEFKYYCYRNSTAETYAKNNNIKCSYLDPAKVTMSSVTNMASGVNVSWKKASGAEGYYVYRKTSSTSWTKIATIESGSTVSYTDKTAKAGSTYIYTVKAYKGKVAGSYDKTGKSIKRLTQPSVSVANSTSGITVKWNKGTGAGGYYVYRKTSSTSWTKIATIKSGSTISYTDKAAKAGSTYIYTVKAYSGQVVSSYDKTGKSIKRLTQPSVSVANSTSGITVKWGKVTGAGGYYVYRKTSSTSWTKIATIKSGSTVSYTDKTAKAGSTYIYTVKAYSGQVVSSYNKTGKSIKRLTQPSVSVANSTSGITVKWGKVTGAGGYYVYRKTSSTSWTKIATIKSGSTVSYTDKTAKAGSTYIYTVRAYSGQMVSSYNTTGKSIKRLK